MPYGPPPGFEQLIARKYDILQQNANSQTEATKAAASLDLARAGVIPNESRANIANTNANTAFLGEQARYFGPTALANIGLAKANARESLARGSLAGEQSLSEQNLRQNVYSAPGGFAAYMQSITGQPSLPTTATANQTPFPTGIAKPVTPYRLPDITTPKAPAAIGTSPLDEFQKRNSAFKAISAPGY